MYRFWETIIQPLCQAINAKIIVEVGSQNGFQTKKLLEYAPKVSGKIISIDPYPNFAWQEWEKQYAPYFKMYTDLSLNVLPTLENYDVILLDGDHNWYTVYFELKNIYSHSDTMPLVFLHDVCWPYDRRDLYYNPNNIPEQYRNPYAQKAISPYDTKLVDKGVNDHLCNAIEYFTPQNGVLTAIEDFLKSNPHLGFEKLECICGLGIIYDRKKYTETIRKIINKDTLLALLSDSEAERTREFYLRFSQRYDYEKTIEKYKKLNYDLTTTKEEMQKQQEKLIEALGEAKTENASLSNILHKVEIENTSLSNDLHEAEVRNKDLNENIANLEKAKQDIDNKLKLEKAKQKSLQDNKAKLQKEIDRQKSLYQTVIGSFRYQAGLILAEAFQSPKKFVLTPIHLLALSYRYSKVQKNRRITEKNPSEYTGIEISRNNETNIPVFKINMNQTWREYPFQEIKKQIMLKINIIVPVYNAPNDLERCIESVLLNTKGNYRLILINDCSTDERISAILSKYNATKQIQILENNENIGFVKTVNKGISSTTGDVVLLNSDTIVTRNWLVKLAIAAYSEPQIMTVTPFSNAAGAFSVPESGKNTEIPDDFTLEEMGHIVEKCSWHEYVNVPTGNGFCMFVKREAFEQVGLLDAETFSRGYGEENDFCMRLIRKGYKNIICDDTYIYHRRSASFAGEKEALIKKHREILDSKYPEYTSAIKVFQTDSLLNKNRKRIEDSLQSHEKIIRKRILYIVHEGGGGTVKTNEDLMMYVAKNDYECYMLTSDMFNMFLYRIKDNKLENMKTWKLNKKWDINRFYTPEYENIYFDVIKNLEIDFIHIRHLFKHSFDILNVAKQLNIPVIMSFHDFYFICPTIYLLNSKGIYCGGKCRKCDTTCLISTQHIKISGSISHWVNNVWRKEIQKVFMNVDVFVTTSEYTKHVYLEHYPELVNRFRIIEHGRDFAYKREYMGKIPTEKVKILVAGNINYAKGEEYILNLIKSDTDKKLEFHVMGNIVPSLASYVIYHGVYKREEFYIEVKKIQPAYIGIFSIWPETYCHVLTESWSCGLPAIISNIGTLQERGIKNGGCILVDLDNPAMACKEIIEKSFNKKEYQKLCDEALHAEYRTVEEMGNDYLQIYRRI